MSSSPAEAAVFDLTGRGSIAVRGKDRADLLHGLVTNDVKALKAGAGCHAAFLTPKGKMLADLVVLCRPEELILDCDPALAPTLAPLVSKYVFYQAVTVEDRTDATAVLHVTGPGGAGLLERLGTGALPDVEHANVEATVGGIAALVVHASRTGAPGYDVRAAREHAAALLDVLASGGARHASADELETARVLAGIPRWGRELDTNVLPNEALLERDAISYSKGCYIGQETVARLKTYGHVNRLLVRIELPPGAGVAPGAEVFAENSRTGALTSVARRAEPPTTVALGYVKRDVSAPGTAVTVGPGAVAGTIVPLRPEP